MNTGQMMLTLGAMVLLSVLVLRMNNRFASTEDVLNQTKFGVLATSLGTSIIEEASKKAFDAATDGNPITDINLLTDPGSLGPNALEYYPNFNDFDDFNGFEEDITNLPSATFHISCSVIYINPSNPEVNAGVKTWHKKITVTITSPFTKDTVRLSSIYSYWYFR